MGATSPSANWRAAACTRCCSGVRSKFIEKSLTQSGGAFLLVAPPRLSARRCASTVAGATGAGGFPIQGEFHCQQVYSSRARLRAYFVDARACRARLRAGCSRPGVRRAGRLQKGFDERMGHAVQGGALRLKEGADVERMLWKLEDARLAAAVPAGNLDAALLPH